MHAQNEELLNYPREANKALVIGVSDYGANLHPLHMSRKDGEELYNLLKTLNYKISDNHYLVGYVPYETMRDAIYDFFTGSSVHRDDTLLFYFSGHGMPGSTGEVYLATSEIDPDKPSR